MSLLASDLLLYAGAFYAAKGFLPVPNKTISISLHGVRTGSRETRQNSKLMMMQLRNLAWDETADIDLAGHAF